MKQNRTYFSPCSEAIAFVATSALMDGTNFNINNQPVEDSGQTPNDDTPV